MSSNVVIPSSLKDPQEISDDKLDDIESAGTPVIGPKRAPG